MTVGGLIPSQTYKDLVACEDNTAVFFRALHGSALENRRKWYGLGVPQFFKRSGIRYLMVRLPTPRFFT